VAVLMQMVGMSPALGAFLAGVVLAESEFRRELETDIEPFRGLLLGLFFITVGASLNFAVVTGHPFALLGVVAGVLLAKGVVMYGLGRAFRMTRGDAAATATSLSQVGEFAFVLLSFTAAAGVLTTATTEFLTAVVALSMATTPLAMAGYERLASIRGPAPLPTPEQYPFETGTPDAIIAGFGRFGQVVGRLLSANRFKTVVLDVSIEHIDLLRKFGRRVHYGDASRLDLLRSAGAGEAKLLVVAIDDRDKATEIVEIARHAFPKLKILARAWDRRHAYELITAGADHVERETFESALSMGLNGLKALGVRASRATKAAEVFRKHDLQALKALAPASGDEEKYVMAIRDSQDTMNRLLAADMAALRAEDGDPDDLPWADEDLSSYDYSIAPPEPPADPAKALRDAVPEGSA
jgi:voltage-gated potassium channel Kch